MDVGSIVNLGIGGFALLVMWWMYQSAQMERKEHFESFRQLEREVRDKILTQLNENTKAFERVLDHFGKQ